MFGSRIKKIGFGSIKKIRAVAKILVLGKYRICRFFIFFLFVLKVCIKTYPIVFKNKIIYGFFIIFIRKFLKKIKI